MNNPLWTNLLRPALAAVLLVAGACAASGNGTVTVLASWTGTEEQEFRQVLADFTATKHIDVDYRGTRALDQVLASDVQQGTTPDVAILPNPGSLATYARSQQLLPLDDLIGPQIEQSYSKQWQTLARAGTTHLYAVAVKADLKSAIWYDVRNLPGPKPATWQELLSLSQNLAAAGRTPWCLGMGATATSGWPGTDWIEDILLHSAGPDAYRQWSAGKLPWTSPQVRQAWLDWGALVAAPGAVRGGTTAALLTDFSDAGRRLFTRVPGCALEHQASFAMGGYLGLRLPDGSTPKPGTDFDFFPFPGPPVSEVSADLAGMFHDTAQARELMKYLASDRAQRIWPGIHRGSVFSASKAVGPGVYGDSVSQKVASTLTSSPQLCFDASDLMPATMTGAFYRAVLEYLSDQSRLDDLLAGLEKTRQSMPAGSWLDLPCGQ